MKPPACHLLSLFRVAFVSLSCRFRVTFVSLVLSLYFPLSRNREYVVFSIYIEIKALDDNVIIDQWVVDFDVDREYYVFPVSR